MGPRGLFRWPLVEGKVRPGMEHPESEVLAAALMLLQEGYDMGRVGQGR